MARKHEPPFFQDRTWAARQKQQTTLQATSSQTGLQHSFTNLGAWEEHAKQSELDGVAKLRTQLLTAAPFYSFVDQLQLDTQHLTIKLKFPVYRFCNPKFGPLTIVGNTAGGGRFNIGGAQVRAEFPNLNVCGCLYVASSPQCSLAEAAPPHGVLKMYEISPKREFLLWDLKALIEEIEYPNLMDAIQQSGGEKIWAYQKAPAISQILAHKVRSVGGDGIQFESTKLKGHFNIALFFDTDAHVAESLSYTEIEKPTTT